MVSSKESLKMSGALKNPFTARKENRKDSGTPKEPGAATLQWLRGDIALVYRDAIREDDVVEAERQKRLKEWDDMRAKMEERRCKRFDALIKDFESVHGSEHAKEIEQLKAEEQRRRREVFLEGFRRDKYETAFKRRYQDRRAEEIDRKKSLQEDAAVEAVDESDDDMALEEFQEMRRRREAREKVRRDRFEARCAVNANKVRRV
ncbi:hypothetical protein HIM_08548 [Hirsutella minnesotensis 3608]|uniref:Uncharacterized protein n=1 Tax=Hirsutella minnesotensis 3608 TaxID=1043627 RepID=A0A0F7ZSW9_9HYPO|nr:hypothetical protein HIM_08548 [Hirsutella minnesotensis 3608]